MSRVVPSLVWMALSLPLLGLTSVGSWDGSHGARAAEASPLISRTRAARYGLERQWYTQVPLDASRGRVTHVTFVPKSDTCPDTLFVQTDQAIVTAIDAKTGKAIWAKQVGRAGLVSGAVGCNDRMAGVISGSTISILDRIDGRTLWTKCFSAVPVSGPVLSKRYAYIPLFDGCVAAYPIRKVETLEDKAFKGEMATSEGSDAVAAPAASAEPAIQSRLILSQKEVSPLYCPSAHRIKTQPILIQDDFTKDRLAWINDRGMYVGSIDVEGEKFRLEYSLATSLAFEATPALALSRFFIPEKTDKTGEVGETAEATEANVSDKVKDDPFFAVLLIASTDGQVNAARAGNGAMQWEYHIGEPIVQPVTVIGSKAYVISQFGLMICFDVQSGKKLWTRRDVSQFVAQTKERIYVRDLSGKGLLILRATDGSQLDRISIPGVAQVVCNDKTGQIFLATEKGLIQSLHQRTVDEPLRHRD